MIHVHIYRVGPYMVEGDIDTDDPVEAKTIALDMLEKQANGFKSRETGTKYIAIIPLEENQTGR